MNLPIKHLPEPTPAHQMATRAHELARKISIYGKEPLNSERCINRMAAKIQEEIDAEVKRLLVDDAEKQQLRKELSYTKRQVADMHSASDRREKTLCQLRASVAVAKAESDEKVRVIEAEIVELREAITGYQLKAEKLAGELLKASESLTNANDTAAKLTAKLKDARHIADSLREENRRMAAELQSLSRFRRKRVDEMAVRVFEHKDMLT